MGTGRTWKADGRFWMNYSEIHKQVQEISFAVSDDLLHWEKLGKEYTIRPDPRWYITRPEETASALVRWDCIVPVPKADGTWAGFLTASSRLAPQGCAAVVGAVESPDGIHWKPAEPSLQFCRPFTEVSGHAKFENRYYLFVNSYEEWAEEGGLKKPAASGIFYLCGNAAEGPYIKPDHFNLIQGRMISNYGNSGAIFGTAFEYEGKWLWNHHARGHEHVWFSTVKELAEDTPWHLSLRYWEGNEKLKGRLLIDGTMPHASFPQPVQGRPLCTDWKQSAIAVSGYSAASSGLAVIELPEAAKKGCFVRFRMRVDNGGGGGSAGIYAGGGPEKPEALAERRGASPVDGLAVLLSPEGIATAGHTSMGMNAPQVNFEESFRTFPFRDEVEISAIIRNEFAEIYADGRFVRDLVFKEGLAFNGKIGFFIDRCHAEFDGLQAWDLSI
jgi:hypothetical protein